MVRPPLSLCGDRVLPRVAVKGAPQSVTRSSSLSHSRRDMIWHAHCRERCARQKKERDVPNEREQRELERALESLEQASSECVETLKRVVDRVSQLLENSGER